MGSSTESVAARIDSDTKAKLALAAEERGVTMSTYVKTVIQSHVDRNPHNLQAFNPAVTSDPDASGRPTGGDLPDNFVEEMLEDLE